MSRLLPHARCATALSTAGFIAALAHMKLANIAAVLQIAPLLITALSVMLYREVVGWRRWTAIGVGFVGALLVIKPIPSEFNIWAIVARGLGASPPPCAKSRPAGSARACRSLVVAFWGAVAITLCGAAFVVGRGLAHVRQRRAVPAVRRRGRSSASPSISWRSASATSTSRWWRRSATATCSPPALGGFLVFGEVPDGWTVVGAVLIVGSGIYTLHREAVRRRDR